jgi:hypothetical protein
LLALPGSFGGGWLRSPADAWGPVAVSGAVALSAFVIIEFYFILFILLCVQQSILISFIEF